MNSINHSFTGLVSSLLATVGFSRLAEKLDPLMLQGGNRISFLNGVKSADFCTACNFQSADFCTACNFQSADFCTACNFQSADFCTACNFQSADFCTACNFEAQAA